MASNSEVVRKFLDFLDSMNEEDEMYISALRKVFDYYDTESGIACCQGCASIGTADLRGKGGNRFDLIECIKCNKYVCRGCIPEETEIDDEGTWTTIDYNHPCSKRCVLNPITIFVQSSTATREFNVHQNTLIGDFIKMAIDEENAKDVSVFFAGKYLPHNKTIRECKLSNESTISVKLAR